MRDLAPRILDTAQPSAALAVMLFVGWAEEECGARLPPAERKLLEEAQAHLLAWMLVRDRIADGGAADDAADLLPLLLGALERLHRLFGPRDRFWVRWRWLVRQQVAADRWERAHGPLRFGPALVRRLGHKAALLRWPAAAVSLRTGRGRSATRLDRAFDDLLAALQLFDDVADAAEDEASGQPNAALAAGAPAPVHAAALALLGPLSRAKGGLGAFAGSIVANHLRARRIRAAQDALRQLLS